MASRREFLQAGIAALALPITAQAMLSPGPGSPESALRVTPLYKVIFDERFPASVAFGDEAKGLGLPVHSIRGDITDLWFHDLDARWKQQPVAVAGLTAQGPLFCLERLAWDHGMRVVFRGDHRYLPEDTIEHALTGPESTLRYARALEREGDEWAWRVADLVANVPEGAAYPASTNIRGRAKSPVDRESEHLISWVIAPVAGARVIRKA